MKKGKQNKTAAPPEPWERQPNESDKAFQAFAIYRDMGANGQKRSIRAVAQKLKKSTTIIGRWSSNLNWVERANAWDDELDRLTREELTKGIAEMRKRHAKIAQAMLAKALKGLQRIPEDEMSSQDVAKIVDIASKLERLSRGEPTERTEGKQIVAGEISLSQIDLSKVTDEELAKLDAIAEKISAKSE